MALIGIHEVAAAFIQERVDEAAAEAAYAASERLTTRFLRPAAAPAHPDVDECFEAFQAACQLRAPFCDSIQMEWGHDLDGVPGVAFGLAPGNPEQILYQADPNRSKQLYLNGFWTSEHSLEEDLLEQFPGNSWARLGACNAARDLLAIQDTGYRLMKAQKQASLQEIDQGKGSACFRRQRLANHSMTSTSNGTSTRPSGWRATLRTFSRRSRSTSTSSSGSPPPDVAQSRVRQVGWPRRCRESPYVATQPAAEGSRLGHPFAPTRRTVRRGGSGGRSFGNPGTAAATGQGTPRSSTSTNAHLGRWWHFILVIHWAISLGTYAEDAYGAGGRPGTDPAVSAEKCSRT